jgi:O-antigen/teichoic acid export membrane protein/peptidoglycan/xylan/chitin deacetylase (PgdA/CDA1 family)
VIRRLVKTAFCHAAAWARLEAWIERGQPVVIGYHRVLEDDPGETVMPGLWISLSMLERHLDWIGRRCRFVTLDELGALLEEGIRTPVAAVTFDDGYADVHGALPMLRRKGIPAAVFVVSDAVEGGKALLHDRVYRALAWALRGDRALPPALATCLGYRRLARRPDLLTSTVLASLRREEILALLDALEADVGPAPGDGDGRSLADDTLRDLHAAGIIIGSHPPFRLSRRAIRSCGGARGGAGRLPLRLHRLPPSRSGAAVPDHPPHHAVGALVAGRGKSVLRRGAELPDPRGAGGARPLPAAAPGRDLMQTKRPVLWLVGGRLAGVAGTIAIPFVLARVLDPTEFGAYRQLFLVFATLYAVAQIGMAECLYYFVPRGGDDDGRFAANSMVALAAVGVAGAALLAFASHPIAAIVGNPEVARWLPALGAFLACMLVSAVLEIVLVSRGRVREAAAAYFVSDIVRAGFLVVPAIMVRTVSAVIAGAVAFAGLRLVATVAVMGRGFAGRFRPDFRLLPGQLAYALPFAAAIVIDTLQAQLHFYFVSHRFDVATFAAYSVACFQIPAVDYLVSAAGNVLMVDQARRAGDPAAVLGAWRDTVARLSLALVPLAAWILVAGPDIIVFLFGPRYAASGGLFVLGSMAILGAALPTDASLRAFAETRFLFWVGIVRLVVVAISLPILVAVAGLAGAILSSLLSLIAGKAFALTRVRRRLGVRWAELLPRRRLLATLIAAGGAAVFSLAVVRALPWPSAFLRLGAAAAAFAPAFWLLATRLKLLPGLAGFGLRRVLDAAAPR